MLIRDVTFDITYSEASSTWTVSDLEMDYFAV